MTISLFVTLFCIGFVGSFISGLVGIGGAIINYPMLLYVPAAFGFVSYTAHEVTGISAIQVLFATMAGVWALRKEKLVHYPLVVVMGSAIIVGSLLGSYGGAYLEADAINVVYAILATLAVIMMFLPQKGQDDIVGDEVTFSKPVAWFCALVIGCASGIVGAAGAFILVPVMLTILKIPTRVAIGSSLAITFLSSIGTTIGKVSAGDVPLWPSCVVVLASILAAPLGARLGKRINPRVLKGILSVLILATTLKIWIGLFF